MTDLETRLRDAMHTALPEAFDSAGFANGARRYAARSRRVRAGSAALVAAVVVAIIGATSSGLFRDRAAVPARPAGVLNLCPDLQRVVAPVRDVPRSADLQAVLVCALVDVGSAWPGSLPPDEAVVGQAALGLLHWSAAGDAPGSCGNVPRGRAFTVSTRDLQGRDRTFLNTDLACDGWPFLGTYYVALAELDADWQAGHPSDSYPSCPSILHDPDRNQLGAPGELSRGVVLRSVSVCTHPTAVPVVVGDTSSPKQVFVRRGVLGDLDLARINADLARTGAAKTPQPCGPKAKLHATYVLRAVTTEGRAVSLTARDECLPTFAVDHDRTLTLRLAQATVDALLGDRVSYP